MTGRGRRGTHRGFTLVELLVVITIMAVVVGITMLSVSVSFREPEDMEKEALRLATLLDMVSEESLFQSRTFGLLFEETGYQFYEWDREAAGWSVVDNDAQLVSRDLPEDIFFTLVVEDREVVLKRRRQASEDDLPRPHVAVLPTGEITPFTVTVNREFSDKYFTLTAEADGTTELEEFDPDAF